MSVWSKYKAVDQKKVTYLTHKIAILPAHAADALHSVTFLPCVPMMLNLDIDSYWHNLNFIPKRVNNKLMYEPVLYCFMKICQNEVFLQY